MSRKRHLALAACVAALGATAATQAAPVAEDASLEAGALSVRYAALHEQASKLGVAPKRDLLAGDRTPTAKRLRTAIQPLEKRVAAARKKRREEQRFAASGGSIEGVSLETLNSIAACESGGNPGAVNSAGYYGKYQFDMGTWASVGGSGNPAEASEAEQDYRAALLYSRAGSSPWPVCGA